MKKILSIIIFFSYLSLGLISCTGTKNQQSSEVEKNKSTTASPKIIFTPDMYTVQEFDRMTDPRDGEIYTTVKIGNQIWMAENLRYNAKGSMLHPDDPPVSYGRLYDGLLAQTVCPDGWHLPSDNEWSSMEITLGLSPFDAVKTFWRGEHGAKMKSTSEWLKGKNGTNSSGFNGYPSGYYFSDEEGGEFSRGGSAGYWSSLEGGKAWARFLGSPLDGVNRFGDDQLNWGLACRCVKD